MTLIEVLAGIALLGSLLVGIVLARGRYVRQWTTAEQRLHAVHAADELLAVWCGAGQDGVPRAASGSCGPDSAMSWRTRTVQNEDAARLNAEVVRLEIRSPTRLAADSSTPGDALLVVEVLVPRQEQAADGGSEQENPRS